MAGQIPVRFLVEQLKQSRHLIENLDWIAAHTQDLADRKRLWKIRTEVLEILERDLELKRWKL